MTKIIKNKYIPFEGYKLMNVCGLLFYREGSSPIKDTDYTHEDIHTRQMQELGYVFFYIIYVIEWFFNLFRYSTPHSAYRNISFEKEAFRMQSNAAWTRQRKHFSQWRKNFGLES